MAVPRRETSERRRNRRHASSYRLPRTTVVECPNCHESKLPHRVCPKCGYYDGREVISMEDRGFGESHLT